MTEIRSLNGIPGNELIDRGKLVSANAPYIPFTQMTQGEMRLALLNDEAMVYAAMYPDFPVYKEIAAMYQGALRKGLPNVSQVGAIYDPMLQRAAANIEAAKRFTRPAAGASITGRNSLVAGIHIGEEPLFTAPFEHDCVKYATAAANKKFGRNKSWQWWNAGVFPEPQERRYYNEIKDRCKTRVEIEKILNAQMVQTGHHMIYKDISSKFQPLKGSVVIVKKLLHMAGIGGLAQASEISEQLMSAWVETSVVRKNGSVGAGAASSLEASISIAPDPERWIAEYNQFLLLNPTQDPKKGKMGGKIQAPPGVGIAFVPAVTAIVGAITAAVAAAATLQKELNAKKAGALSTALGFGSDAFKGQTDDFSHSGDLNDPNTDTAEKSDNTLLLLGGLAALYFLTQE